MSDTRYIVMLKTLLLSFVIYCLGWSCNLCYKWLYIFCYILLKTTKNVNESYLVKLQSKIFNIKSCQRRYQDPIYWKS